MEKYIISSNKIEELHKESKHYLKNRGYFTEDLGEKAGLWQRLKHGLKHNKSGDVAYAGTHYQVKYGHGGQIECDSWEKLESRLNEEYSNKFIVAIPKGNEVLFFYFEKKDFIDLVLNNKDLLKLEKKSTMNGGTPHFRLAFGTSRKKIVAIKKAAYQEKHLRYTMW